MRRSPTTFLPPSSSVYFTVVGLCSLLVSTGSQPSSSPTTGLVTTASATSPVFASSGNTTVVPGPALAGHYVLTDANGLSCAAISCSFNITIPYNTTAGTSSNYIFTPPCSGESGVYVNGTCGSQHESMVINFKATQWLLQFDLVKVKDRYSVTNVYLAYILDPALFLNVTDKGKSVTYNASGLDLFGAAYGSYYSCQAASTANLGNGYQMKTLHFEILAFTNSTSTAGLGKHVCNADKPHVDNTVPIAVGAALAALVVIVVVAYFISRRTMRGYQSV